MNSQVLVADDHAAVRAGLAGTLEDAGYRIAAEARTADEVMAILSSTPVDLVVTDFMMPSELFGDGLQYLAALLAAHPDTPIVVLTMLRRPDLLQAIHRLGIAGLVDKASSLKQVVQALRLALMGKTYTSESLLSLMGKTGVRRLTGRVSLSPREEQVLRLVGEGRSIAQIAKDLGTAANTVSAQKHNMMRKLGLRSNVDLSDYIASTRASGASG